jgi:hypothetical protein
MARPFGVGTPNFLKISFAWYSWIFITCPICAAGNQRRRKLFISIGDKAIFITRHVFRVNAKTRKS